LTKLHCRSLPAERPILNYSSGLATAVLRVREDDNPDHERHLQSAFAILFRLYGPGYFDVQTTLNVVLVGDVDQRYSLFYGQGVIDIAAAM
jgi:hypothetical protein